MPRRIIDPPDAPKARENHSTVEADATTDDIWQTRPGRLLAAARAEFLRARGRFLDREELEREWEEERLGSRG